jgi:thiol-disulfide isomerase/thioredoxin
MPAAAAPRGIIACGVLMCLFAALTVHAAELTPADGTVARPLALKTLSGEPHDLAAYRGKVVLVNFWASWCEPCRDEMPSIERLRERLAGEPFEVLAVNVDEPEARVRRFLEKMPLKFTVLLDPGKKVTKAWNARILPASFLIGRDGRVRYLAVGDLDWNEAKVVRTVVQMLRTP